MGDGVVDRLCQLGFDVLEGQFGWRPDDARKYANKRAEMWGRLKDWLKGGALPRDEQLATDLASVEYGFNQHDQIPTGTKKSMRAKGVASPDDADALALTFAYPVPIEIGMDLPRATSAHEKEHEALESIAMGHDPYSAPTP